MADRYKADKLLDGGTAYAIYLSSDVDCDRPQMDPIRDRQLADDLAWVLNQAAQRPFSATDK